MTSLRKKHLGMFLLASALMMNVSWVHELVLGESQSTNMASKAKVKIRNGKGGSSSFSCSAPRFKCSPVKSDFSRSDISITIPKKVKIEGIDKKKSKGKSFNAEFDAILVDLECTDGKKDNKGNEKIVAYATGVSYWEKDNLSEANCPDGSCYDMVLPKLNAKENVKSVHDHVIRCLDDEAIDIARKKRKEKLQEQCRLGDDDEVLSGWDSQVSCKIENAETKKDADEVYDILEKKLTTGSMSERLAAHKLLNSWRGVMDIEPGLWGSGRFALLGQLGHDNNILNSLMKNYQRAKGTFAESYYGRELFNFLQNRAQSYSILGNDTISSSFTRSLDNFVNSPGSFADSLKNSNGQPVVSENSNYNKAILSVLTGDFRKVGGSANFVPNAENFNFQVNLPNKIKNAARGRSSSRF